MATTVAERKLLIGGEWIETGERLDVRSPYSGDVVGRVAKAGADETRRAIDAADAAMREPLPAHKRAEILVKVAGLLGRRHDEVARLISDDEPATTLSHPGGNPASCMSSASSTAESGVADAGLRTTAQPAASEGASLCATRLHGKLNGVIAPTTPRGDWWLTRPAQRERGSDASFRSA